MSIPSSRSLATLGALGVLLAGLLPGAAEEGRKRPVRTYGNADLPARQPAPVPGPLVLATPPAAALAPAVPSSDGTAARAGADWSVGAWETRLSSLRTERQAAERKVAELEDRLARLGFELLDLSGEAAEKRRDQLTQVRVDLGAAREALDAIRASQPGLVEKARICGVSEARAGELVAP
jgi:hypothetical protein